MGPYEFLLNRAPLPEEIKEALPYDAGWLVHEAERDRRLLEDTLEPMEFLTLNERWHIGIIEREKQHYLEEEMGAEASVCERHIQEYARQADERKNEYIELMLNMHNPYPELFSRMPSEEEIEEAQRLELSYRAWQYADGSGLGTDTPHDMYMRLFGESRQETNIH